MLAAVASGLSLTEAVIPSPLPGVKPGLANIVVLIVLLQHGLQPAIWVSALRVLAGSLLLGSFLSPGFWLSLTGASVSLAVLAIMRYLPNHLFGPVSLSVLAAFGHIGGQLVLAWGWLLPATSIGYLLPVFAAAALVFGAVNGVIVARLLKTNLLAVQGEDRRQSPPCIPPTSP